MMKKYNTPHMTVATFDKESVAVTGISGTLETYKHFLETKNAQQGIVDWSTLDWNEIFVTF